MWRFLVTLLVIWFFEVLGFFVVVFVCVCDCWNLVVIRA